MEDSWKLINGSECMKGSEQKHPLLPPNGVVI